VSAGSARRYRAVERAACLRRRSGLLASATRGRRVIPSFRPPCGRVALSVDRQGGELRRLVHLIAAPRRGPTFEVRKSDREIVGNQGVSEAADAGVALGIAPNPPDPDLARVVAAWPELPEAIRRAVLALIGSADG